MEEIKIPAMGESVTEATIASFLKQNGETVREGEEIVELETEKVNQVLYAPSSGILTWKVKVGETHPIGAVIGSIEKGGEQPPAEKPPPKATRVKKEDFLAEFKKPEPAQTPQPQPPPPAPEIKKEERETRRQMSKIRKTIASRLVDALHQAAMLTTFNEVDMGAIAELRTKYKESFQEKHGVKLGLMSFFVKAVVEGLKQFPDLNSYIDGEEIVHREYYDIGIAVSTNKGLVVPVIRDCDQKSFGEIEKEIASFATKARGGKLTIDDLQGGGFTITNGGVFGSLLSTPILNPPQSGILGMHAIFKRPVVVNDEIVVRPMMYLALSYDHRIVDGKEAISFLVLIRQVLEDPSRLMFLDSDGKV